MSHEDIFENGLPVDLDWSPERRVESLHRVHRHALAHCEQSIEWYQREKKWKKEPGKILRLLAIILSGLSGLIPILSNLSLPGLVALPATWATVALALAALMIALDRFFGVSAGWIRYEQASQRLGHRRCRFDFDWAELMIPREQDLRVIDIQMAVSLCRDFLHDVNRIVADETDQWAGEFNRRLLDHDATLPGSDPRP